MLVSRNMRENTKLDLRIVGIDKHVILIACNEIFTEASARIGSYRYILKIWIGGGKAPRSSTRLIEGGVGLSLLVRALEQTVNVRALKLCHLSVFKYTVHGS